MGVQRPFTVRRFNGNPRFEGVVWAQGQGRANKVQALREQGEVRDREGDGQGSERGSRVACNGCNGCNGCEGRESHRPDKHPDNLAIETTYFT